MRTFQCACSQLQYYHDIVPSCMEEFKNQSDNNNLHVWSRCITRKLKKVNESDFTRVFVGTRIFDDATSSLASFAAPDKMDSCSYKFEMKIYNDIESIQIDVRKCFLGHYESAEWQEYLINLNENRQK